MPVDGDYVRKQSRGGVISKFKQHYGVGPMVQLLRNIKARFAEPHRATQPVRAPRHTISAHSTAHMIRTRHYSRCDPRHAQPLGRLR